MPLSASPAALTAYCSWCDCYRPVSWWQSDTDPGDAGLVRSCSHGDFVHREDCV